MDEQISDMLSWDLDDLKLMAQKTNNPNICTVCLDPVCWGEYTHFEDPNMQKGNEQTDY